MLPSAEMQLPAVSSCCCPLWISPGVCCCCCWGFATACRLPVSAQQTSSPDARKAAKIRALGCGSPNADGGTCIAVGLPAPRHSNAAGRAACSLAEPRSRPVPLPLLPRQHPAQQWPQRNKTVCAPVQQTDRQFGGQEGRGQRVTFSVSYLCFLALGGVLHGQKQRQV